MTMPRKNKKEFEITHISGNTYSNLQEAQESALPTLAQSLSDTMRDMLRDGSLVIDDKTIRPFRPGDEELVEKYKQALNKPIDNLYENKKIDGLGERKQHKILQDMNWLDDSCEVYFLIADILDWAEAKGLSVNRRVYYN